MTGTDKKTLEQLKAEMDEARAAYNAAQAAAWDAYDAAGDACIAYLKAKENSNDNSGGGA